MIEVPAYWYALSMEDAWQHRLTAFMPEAALANSFYDTHSQEQRAYVVVVAKGYRPPCGKSKSSEVMVIDAPADLGGEQAYSLRNVLVAPLRSAVKRLV